MFVYEKGNTLNLTFKGNLPVDNPEVVIKGYEDGATLTVDGTVYGTGTKEFEGKAKTLVYQKDDKLAITFKGISGINNPEITIDEIGDDVFAVAVGEDHVTLSVVDDTIIPVTEVTQTVEDVPSVSEPVVEPDIDDPVITEVEDDIEAE